MNRVRQDVAHALRGAARQPGATAAIVCVLALGVGLSTTMFALADPFILRPLPYPAPESLVAIELRIDPSAEHARISSLAEWRDLTGPIPRTLHTHAALCIIPMRLHNHDDAGADSAA